MLGCSRALNLGAFLCRPLQTEECEMTKVLGSLRDNGHLLVFLLGIERCHAIFSLSTCLEPEEGAPIYGLYSGTCRRIGYGFLGSRSLNRV